MIKTLLKEIRFYYLKKKWRRINRHNDTIIKNYFPIDRVSVGNKTYGPLKIIWMAPKDAYVHIGNYCSIGPSVTFLVGGEHNYKRISTYPFQTLVYHEVTRDENINRNIVIEDDVWIGFDTLILSGVTVGKGSVVGARSVVSKNIPPYSIYVGNKIIKKRFSDKIIEKLKRVDYSKINHTSKDSYKDLCQEEVTEDNIDCILRRFNV